jgi:NADPH-dependent 2,4-dienoyl-CoA reductase/sulfur reductase-like enzyme
MSTVTLTMMVDKTSTPVVVVGDGLAGNRTCVELRKQGYAGPILEAGVHVVVVGASWIGAEVAHAALERGCQATCIEYHPAPLAQALGRQIGARFADWWRQAELRTGQSVVAIEPDGVHLATGEVVAGDVVVAGAGCGRRRTGWSARRWSCSQLWPSMSTWYSPACRLRRR